MSRKWLNRIEYYLLCTMPAPVLYIVNTMLGPAWFFTGFMLYIFWYRPFVDIYRLRKLGVIEEAEAWKFFLPLYASRYRKVLWFG